jgi:hypothetical protein
MKKYILSKRYVFRRGEAMTYKLNWRKLARKMRESGYSILAISETLVPFDLFIPERTLYHACRGISPDKPAKTTALCFLDALLFLEDDLGFCNISDVLHYSNEGDNISEEIPHSSPCVFDCSEHDRSADVIDEFGGKSGAQIWYPTSRSKDGLKSYLIHEKRQNTQEEQLPYHG